jgi:dolichol kinase
MPPFKSSILKEEAKRKTIHIGGIAIPVLYLFLSKETILFGFVLSFIVISVIEWLRLRGIVSLPFLRNKEEKEIGAYVFFMIGAFLSILSFEKLIAIAAILMLAIGDAASGLTGAVINEDKPELYERRMKSPEVMLVMFVTSLILGGLVLHSIPVAVLGAFGAMIADGMPLRFYDVQIDDNLTIPLFSGVLMSVGSMW